MSKKKQRTNGKRVIAVLTAILMFLMMAAMTAGCDGDKNDADPSETPSATPPADSTATPPADSTPDEYPFVGTWEWDDDGDVFTFTFRRDGTAHFINVYEGEVWEEYDFEWEIDADGDIAFEIVSGGLGDGDSGYWEWEMDGDRRLILDGITFNKV